MRQIGDGAVVQRGEQAVASGLAQPGHRLFGELLIVAHDAVHLLARGLAFGDRDLLDGVLKLDPGRLQPFGDIRPMQQFEGGHALAFQPVLQHPADQGAGMGRIEFGWTAAGRRDRLVGDLLLSLLRRAQRQNGQGAEFHRLGVQRLLGHARGDGETIPKLLLGGLDGVFAVFGRDQQRPRRRGALADIDFVMDRTRHGPILHPKPLRRGFRSRNVSRRAGATARAR